MSQTPVQRLTELDKTAPFEASALPGSPSTLKGNIIMNRQLIASALIAASAFVAAAPSFAEGLAEYNQRADVVSQYSRAEVKTQAVAAARHAADVDTNSQVLPAVKSAITRQEVRQAAAQANRAGLLPHGEASF